MQSRLYPISSRPRTQWAIYALLFLLFLVATPYYNVLHSTRGNSTTDEIMDATEHQQLFSLRTCALATLGFMGVCAVRQSRRLRSKGIQGGLLMLFVLDALLSVIWAEDPSFTLRKLSVLVTLAGGAMYMATNLSLRSLMRFAVYACGTVAVLGVTSEICVGTFAPWTAGYHFQGTLTSNSQGPNCACILIASTFLFCESRRRAWAVIAVVSLGALLLTRCRTSTYAALLAVTVLLTLTSQRSRRGLLLLLFICAGIGLALAFGLDDRTRERGWNAALMRNEANARVTANLTGRVPVWEWVLPYVQERPLLGYGYNSFWTGPRVWAISKELYFGVDSAHSSYLEIALGLGIIGLALFVSILISGCCSYYRAMRETKDASNAFGLAFILFYAFNCLTESIVYSPINLHSMIFLSLVVRMGITSDSMAAEKNRMARPSLQRVPLCSQS